ncbi:MAG: alpha/beta hydrolase [Bacteroidota bacterium]
MNTLKSTLLIVLLSFCIASKAQNEPFEVKVMGEGQPILLFPGFTCTGDVWKETVEEISQNYQCHVFTFAGFGGLAPIEKPWLPKIKQGVIDYVSENKLIDPIVVGHSLGGTLGLWLASEENSLFAKIIVVDALPSTGALMIPNFKSENMVYDSPYNKQMLAMEDDTFKQTATQMASFMTLTEEKRPQLIDWILQSDRETYVYGYTDLLKLDLREDISKITSPVTILAATYPYGMEGAKQTYTMQYKNLKSYDIDYAEGSAHFIMYDRPEWFLNKIKEELSQ